MPNLPDHHYIDAAGFGRHIRVAVDARGAYTVIDDMWGLEEQRTYEERMRARTELRGQAAVRSKELFVRLLTDSQRATFESGEWVDVTAASGRTYRIQCGQGHSGNVFWVEPDSKEVKGSFCVYPGAYDLPPYDFFLGQLLLIATDEARFLNVGIFHGPIHPTQGPRRGRFALRAW